MLITGHTIKLLTPKLILQEMINFTDQYLLARMNRHPSLLFQSKYATYTQIDSEQNIAWSLGLTLNKGNSVRYLVVQRMEVGEKYRNQGIATKYLKYIKELSIVRDFDGVMGQSAINESVIRILRKLHYLESELLPGNFYSNSSILPPC